MPRKSGKAGLNAERVQYILSHFDAGATPRQIGQAFRLSWHITIEIAAIELCLQENGRNMFHYQPKIAARGYQEMEHLPSMPIPQQASPCSGSRSVSASTSPYQQPATNGATQASAQALVNLPPDIAWNAQTDAFEPKACAQALINLPPDDNIPWNGQADGFETEASAQALIDLPSDDIPWNAQADAFVAQAYAQALIDLTPDIPWNAQADIFTASAYRVGQTPLLIADQLRDNGYDINVSQVVASLNRQGWTKAHL